MTGNLNLLFSSPLVGEPSTVRLYDVGRLRADEEDLDDGDDDDGDDGDDDEDDEDDEDEELDRFFEDEDEDEGNRIEIQISKRKQT